MAMLPTHIVITEGYGPEFVEGQSFDDVLDYLWTGEGTIPRSGGVAIWVHAIPGGRDRTEEAALILADRSVHEGTCPQHLAAWIDDVGYGAYRARTDAEGDERRAA